MPRYEVTLQYHKEPSVGYTIDAYNEEGAIVMGKERARQEGWPNKPTLSRAIEVEAAKEQKKTDVVEQRHGTRVMNLSFIVREDLPSERVQEYRALILRALEKYTLHGTATVEERLMIDRIMCDHERDNTLVSVIEARRRLIERAYVDDMTTDESHRNNDAIEALTAIIGY